MDNKDVLLLDIIVKDANNAIISEITEKIIIFDLYEGKKIIVGKKFCFLFRMEKFMTDSLLLKLIRVDTNDLRLECNEYFVADYDTVKVTKLYYNVNQDIAICMMRLIPAKSQVEDNSQEILEKIVNRSNMCPR